MKNFLKCLSAVLVLTTLILSLVGCSLFDSLSKPKDKDFSKAGMTITLTDEFTEQELVTHTAYYVSQKSIVVILKENDPLLNNYTLKKYAELVCTANNLDESTIRSKNNYVELTYEKDLNGKEYYYYYRCYKNGNDFWSVQFGCETKNTEELQPFFEKWADTFRFN